MVLLLGKSIITISSSNFAALGAPLLIIYWGMRYLWSVDTPEDKFFHFLMGLILLMIWTSDKLWSAHYYSLRNLMSIILLSIKLLMCGGAIENDFKPMGKIKDLKVILLSR